MVQFVSKLDMSSASAGMQGKFSFFFLFIFMQIFVHLTQIPFINALDRDWSPIIIVEERCLSTWITSELGPYPSSSWAQPNSS